MLGGMKIGIISAMQEEIALVEEKIQNPSILDRHQRRFFQGQLAGHDVVATFSHWGKVAATITTIQLIDHFHCDLLLFTGVAGSIAEHIRIGDIVVASQLVHHDLDARPMFKQFEVPFLGFSHIPATPDYAAMAQQAAHDFAGHAFDSVVSESVKADFHIGRPAIHHGLIATGDAFVSSPEKVQWLREELPGVLCVEMEGAAFAQTAYDCGVPFAVVRVMSDKADSNAPMDFSKFLQAIATPMTGGITDCFLKRLPV